MQEVDQGMKEFPDSPYAFRPILFREMPEILNNLAFNGWSLPLVQAALKQTYGNVFDVTPQVFKARFIRAKKRYLAQQKAHPTSSNLTTPESATIAPPVKTKKEDQSNERKERNSTWEERRTEHFPGSKSVVRHHSKPRKEDLL